MAMETPERSRGVGMKILTPVRLMTRMLTVSWENVREAGLDGSPISTFPTATALPGSCARISPVSLTAATASLEVE